MLRRDKGYISRSMASSANRGGGPLRLRSHLFLLVAGAVVPLALITIVLGTLLVARIQETFRRGALDRNRAFMSAVDAEVRGHESTLRALAASSSLRDRDLAAFRVAMAQVLASQGDWRTVILSDPGGRELLNAVRPLGAALPADADPASLLKAVATQTAAAGNVVRWESIDRYGIAVRLPLVRDGHVDQVLTAIVDPSQFERLIAAQHLPANWVSGLIDATGRFIARVPPRSPDFVASPDFREATNRATEGWYRGRTVEGDDTFTAHLTSSTSGWAVGLAIPASLVYASAWNASWTIGLGVFVTLLVALGFAYAMSQRIARPIARLAARTQDPDRPESDGADIVEIAELARALEAARAVVGERQTLLEREQAALRAADRAKDEFLAMLGHELRNPLSAIAASAHVLRSPVGTAHRLDALAILERQVRQMTRLVDDLLEVSRLTMGKVDLQSETFDLAELVRALVQTWESSGRIRRGRLRLTAQPAWVRADRSRMEQVIANLLDNANKYSADSSAISIDVRASGDEAVVVVSDEGEGIAPELLDHLFDRFVQGPQRVGRRPGGLGLGLAVVRRLVELQGGRVQAANRDDVRGARFTVGLPATPAPEDEPSAVPVRSEGRALRVILVEDLADLRETMEILLRMAGHDVEAVGSGDEALAAARQKAPDVVLLDVGLPDISGYEVARRLRKADAAADRPWLIALTGFGQTEDERRAREAGCDFHLVKPVDPDALLALLAELGGRRRSKEAERGG